jgi:hypothetical protein
MACINAATSHKSKILMTYASCWVQFQSFSTRLGVKLVSTIKPEAACNTRSFGSERDRGADRTVGPHCAGIRSNLSLDGSAIYVRNIKEIQERLIYRPRPRG